MIKLWSAVCCLDKIYVNPLNFHAPTRKNSPQCTPVACMRARVQTGRRLEIVKCTHAFLWQKFDWNITGYLNCRQCHLYWNMPNSYSPSPRPLLIQSSVNTNLIFIQTTVCLCVLFLYNTNKKYLTWFVRKILYIFYLGFNLTIFKI